jgi:hypothetical protein
VRKGTVPRQSKKSLLLISASAAVGMTALAYFVAPIFLNRSAITAAESSSEPLPTGAIAEGDIEFCKRLRFDDHGRVFHDVVPCDQSSMRDARGQPVPVGTVRRLDAISKSFSGH